MQFRKIGLGKKGVSIAAVAMLAGCVASAPQVRPEQVAVARVSAAPAGVPGVPPPAGAQPFTTALSAEQQYDMFLASWVAAARSEDELFNRGGQAYANVRMEYRARIGSNHTSAQARELVMPMIREWLARAPVPSGRYSFQVAPRQLGMPGFQQQKTGLVLSKGEGVVFNIDIPVKHRDPRPLSPRSQAQIAYGLLAMNTFEGKTPITGITYTARSIRSIVLPLTPQQQYDLSRNGAMRATMDGGYLVAEAFSCVQNYDRMSELNCEFRVVDQMMAPIVMR